MEANKQIHIDFEDQAPALHLELALHLIGIITSEWAHVPQQGHLDYDPDATAAEHAQFIRRAEVLELDDPNWCGSLVLVCNSPTGGTEDNPAVVIRDAITGFGYAESYWFLPNTIDPNQWAFSVYGSEGPVGERCTVFGRPNT